MKKILMTIAAAFVAVNMNAQYYIGGSIGFQTKTTPAATTEVTSSGFTLAPEIGMALDDTKSIGIILNYNSTKNETKYVGAASGTPSVEATVTNIQLRPYLRYQVLEYGKANIFVDGGALLAFQSQKDMKAGMDLGLFLSPGISFDINDKWSIAAHINDIFRFAYHKDPVADVTGAPDAPTSMNLRASTGGFTTGNVTFGVYYNF